jgi:hypothetical protein
MAAAVEVGTFETVRLREYLYNKFSDQGIESEKLRQILNVVSERLGGKALNEANIEEAIKHSFSKERVTYNEDSTVVKIIKTSLPLLKG